MKTTAHYDRVVRRLSKALGALLRIAPYDFVQLDVQKHLHRYLHKNAHEVKKLIMVGAHLAFEMDDMLKRYPSMESVLFEASPRYSSALEKRFRNERRVKVFKSAVSNKNGSVEFFETNLSGSGSLLQVGSLAKDSYGLAKAESYTVDCTCLDDHARTHNYDRDEVDCLWVDVQGAELQVLHGATETLKRVHSLFIEISALQPLYEGGATAGAIISTLSRFDFTPVSIGTDYINGTGNAFFLRARSQLRFGLSLSFRVPRYLSTSSDLVLPVLTHLPKRLQYDCRERREAVLPQCTSVLSRLPNEAGDGPVADTSHSHPYKRLADIRTPRAMGP